MPKTSNTPASTILILILLVVFCPLAIDIYLPAFPVIASQLAVPEQHIQQTISLFLLTVGLGQLIAGPLADKYGRKPLTLFGMTLYGVSALAASYATSFEMLLLARLVQGFGACATFVCAFAMVRDSFNANKSAQVMSYLNGVICFIPALAPILGAWLTLNFGWQSNFLFLASFAFISLFLVLFFAKETRPENTLYQGKITDFSRFIPILKNHVFLFHAMICLLAMAVIIAFVSTAPSWLMSHLGLSTHEFTVWFTINAVLSIFASFTAPYFIKRSTRKALLLGLGVLFFSGLLMLTLIGFNTPWAFMLPIFVASIGFSLTLGSAVGKALEPFATQAGTASALIGVMQMSGAGLLVSITLQFGLSAPLLVLMHLTLLVPLLILLYCDKTQRLHPSS
ncbi:multidrug effflux MFS transporter [Pseudoalteromonas tunicata]|uniref:multidrug effflux MFS transporter n=1 Tax=Pseudoalteromonas tunicata TaxID=314281 RepID=UPI00274025FD|nr:multidrug effflux MFS transporter [Pseudoalteromonas tunicata]MDP4985696.1 multidrug effflux MFS transporter [Pseudoalteromonas tunicata]MDP5212978.1 multidrug effflux MFS transporter [Pseudoalteromonas tunicata]